ncbi:hypothetical protein LTR92_001170 [Exophiala xenobiotica]|nr:hypothetical protein LTR92_001170 [Exophiala xenobiotica]
MRSEILVYLATTAKGKPKFQTDANFAPLLIYIMVLIGYFFQSGRSQPETNRPKLAALFWSFLSICRPEDYSTLRGGQAPNAVREFLFAKLNEEINKQTKYM